MTRPWGWRTGARVICTSGNHVLLLADSDPGVPGSLWWVTPGGGVDDGETPRAAARRELHEETGLHVDEESLVGPVAVRTVTHGYSDRVRVQHEWFFRVDVDRFDPDPAGLTAAEKQRLQGFAWWALDDLPVDVWPSELAVVAAASELKGVMNLGTVEESTVPVSSHEKNAVQSAGGSASPF